MRSTQALVTLFAALVTSVHGHGAMVAVTGANGVTAIGMGIDPATPRDGTRRNPFQQDTSIIRDNEIASGQVGPCGRTLAGGPNDVAAGVASAASAGMPSMSATGQVTMTIHQINGDGAGPYTCAMSTDATGTNFVPMTIVTNVPGQNSRSRAKATDFPLVAQAAPGATCTGGPNGDACIVRCRNAARAGPFGGCAVVTNAVPLTPPPVAAAPVTPPAAAAPVTPPAAAAPITPPVATAPVVAPVGNATTPVAPVAEPVAPAAQPVAPVAEPVAPVAQPVAPVAQPATPAPVQASPIQAAVADEEDKRKRSILESITGFFSKREHLERKRMVTSRIVDAQKRGKWI